MPESPVPSPAELRREYSLAELLESNVLPNPMEQFSVWFNDAQKAGIAEPNAMVLATVDADSHPSARVVLMKGMDSHGLVFFTNYESRKGRELEQNPHASLVFFWEPLERQVRLEGVVEQVGRAESEAYFQTRPVSSQIGAWVSQQSKVITSRQELERLDGELKKRFAGQPVPTPPHWGGYRLIPTAIEFWQGRRSRLHDRILYTRKGEKWQIQRLAP